MIRQHFPLAQWLRRCGIHPVRCRPAAPLRGRPELMLLEERCLPSVTLGTNFSGVSGSFGSAPPDGGFAVGPNNIVQPSNTGVAIYDKSGHQLSFTDLNTFFGNGAGGDNGAFWDDLANRFVVEGIGSSLGQVDFAVSKTSDPTQGWNTYTLDATLPGESVWDGSGNNGFGYNADAWIMRYPLSGGSNGNSVLVVPKSNVLNGGTFTYNKFGAPTPPWCTDVVRYEDATPGAPAYFLEDDGGSNYIVTQMSGNYLTGTPTFTTFTIPGGTIFHEGWSPWTTTDLRNGQLVHSSWSGSQVQWIDINTSNMTMAQQGLISTSGTTAYSSINIAPNGAIGLNYDVLSGSTMSMYVTGRAATDAAGTMQTPVLAKSGPWDNGRTGDYSGIGVDPSTGNFWAENQTSEQGTFTWGTWIANFSISGSTATITPGIYTIKNLNSSLLLDAPNNSQGTGIDQASGGGTNQQWDIEPAGNFYTLKNISSGLVLDDPGGSSSPGTQMVEWSANGGTNQEWSFVSLGGGQYQLVNASSALVLDVSGGSTSSGAPVIQWNANGGANQEWSLTPANGGGGITPGTYFVTDVKSGKDLDDPGASTTPGTQMIQWTPNGGTNQKWNIQSVGNGLFTITNVSSGLLLDDKGGSTSAGNPIIQWTANGGTNQQWSFQSLGGGKFKIVNKLSGLVLDVSGGSTSNGAGIVQNTSNSNTDEQWTLTATTTPVDRPGGHDPDPGHQNFGPVVDPGQSAASMGAVASPAAGVVLAASERVTAPGSGAIRIRSAASQPAGSGVQTIAAAMRVTGSDFAHVQLPVTAAPSNQGAPLGAERPATQGQQQPLGRLEVLNVLFSRHWRPAWSTDDTTWAD